MPGCGCLGHVVGMDLSNVTVPKIDDAPVDGLLGVPDSLAYTTDEIEHHVHSPQKIYGGTTAGAAGNPTMLRRSLIPITITAGSTVWGEERIIYRGSGIEEDSFDMNQLRVSAVGTANHMAIYEILYFAAGTPKAAVTKASTDTVEDATNTVADNYKVYFPSLTGPPAPLSTYTVYFVVGRTGTNFQVSLTRGGAAVTFAGGETDACTYVSLGLSDATDHIGTEQALASETIISRASGSPDPMPTPIQMDRIPSDYYMSCRGLAAAGGNSVGFHVGLHVYPA